MLHLDLSTTPVLRTERLVIRETRLDDAPALFRLRSDPQVMKHMGKSPASGIQDAIDLIHRMWTEQAEHNGLSWVITLKGDDTLIGTIGYYRLKKEHHRGEVGYALHSDHWRQGIMREALKAVVDHGFERLGFHSIEAITDPRNMASNNLLERCGFRREGLLRENYRTEHGFDDSAVYGILVSDPRP